MLLFSNWGPPKGCFSPFLHDIRFRISTISVLFTVIIIYFYLLYLPSLYFFNSFFPAHTPHNVFCLLPLLGRMWSPTLQSAPSNPLTPQTAGQTKFLLCPAGSRISTHFFAFRLLISLKTEALSIYETPVNFYETTQRETSQKSRLQCSYNAGTGIQWHNIDSKFSKNWPVRYEGADSMVSA
jgi:hypothetical protein